MKVGLITYHSAYNFGSVLQAYATQEVLKSICGNCEIINYRSKEQKRVYAIFKWTKPLPKSIIKNSLILFSLNERKKREKKYEKIFNDIFLLSKECETPDEVYDLWDRYDLIVSGSDQIWNKHSNELEHVSWEYMRPYLLAGYHGRKVSYASSLTNMKDDEVKYIFKWIKKFNYISFRESETSKRINELFGCKSIDVLDPTFLLSKEEWINKLNLKKNNNNNYILYYSLNSIKDIMGDLKAIKKIGKKKGLKIIVLAPLNIIKSNSDYEVLNSIDPIDFLNLLYNANMVITDSYHGSILSVNFGKELYCICRGKQSDFRKKDILNRIGMGDRIINIPSEITRAELKKVDYEDVNKKISELKEKSYKYLYEALGDNKNG